MGNRIKEQRFDIFAERNPAPTWRANQLRLWRSTFVYSRLLSSYARFRAEFWQEPEDRARLVSRMLKPLLTSVGNALGLAKPTDPTSAHAYPASLPEQDTKSEYMSEACSEGIEKALKKKLPKEAHKPTIPPSP